ncbi:diacylglycerol/lipid kinase family protein [Acinetobacter sp. MB5]|uniref:diacylglycerol/lipid kinase family protein n=1 Tax=Acinetobacter sp. MB5 TaxID=2069438 RepID=UPI000DD08E93|nr:diacylglycerol kinase family protein [Acinetobacter sp. MB5]
MLKPLSIIYNQKSGFHSAQRSKVYDEIMTFFIKYGFEIQLFEFNQQNSIDTLMRQIVIRHSMANNAGVVVVAGGDGTVNAVASYLLNTGITLGILPFGTFNYVARVLNIPLDLMDACHVIATGEVKKVHVAKLNQRIYLNNASLGLYPLFIEKRERYNRLFGRFPLHAYTSALDVLLRRHRELKLEVMVDGEKYPVKTPLVFFGNNHLQLQEMNLKIAHTVRLGKIAGVIVAKSDKMTLMKLLFQLLKGDIEKASDVYSFAADHVTVHAKKRKKLHIAIDGELVEEQSPLHFSVERDALAVMVPANVTASI